MSILSALLGHDAAVDPEKLERRLEGILVDGEEATLAFKAVRDFLVFTGGRLILVDVQGVTGKKVTFTSIPYRSITAFSVETAGTFDMEAELTITLAGSMPPVSRHLSRGADVKGIQRALAQGIMRL